MKKLWKVLAWLSAICGLIGFAIGRVSVFLGVKFLTSAEFWFYVAFVSGIFAIFFLMYSIHSK